MVRLKIRDVWIFLNSDLLIVLSYCQLRQACRIESGGFQDLWSPMRLNIRCQKLPGFINVHHRLPEEKHPKKDYHFWTPLFCHRLPFFYTPPILLKISPCLTGIGKCPILGLLDITLWVMFNGDI